MFDQNDHLHIHFQANLYQYKSNENVLKITQVDVKISLRNRNFLLDKSLSFLIAFLQTNDGYLGQTKIWVFSKKFYRDTKNWFKGSYINFSNNYFLHLVHLSIMYEINSTGRHLHPAPV